MYGIYKMIMSTPRGDTDNYLSIAEDGVAVISGMGIGQGSDVAIDGSKVSFSCSVGPGMWAFTLNIVDGVIEGSAKHGELDDTAPIKGEKTDMNYDAAVAAAANFQGPAGSGGDHGGPGGPPPGMGGPPPAQ